MAGQLIAIASFALGLLAGAGIVFLGVSAQAQKNLKSPPSLTLVPKQSTGTDAVTAQIPPSVVQYEPVYLTEAQIAQRERVQNGAVPKTHDSIEADKRGA